MKPEPISQFNPNKKKARTQKTKDRSAREKRERQWGKTPQKPYISSSIGDLSRVMMRYACMENTYFYNTEPPPVEFYDFWQKFAVEPENYPPDFIDQKRASIANLKKNTSSFDFFGRYTEPVNGQDLNEMDDTGHKHKRKLRSTEDQNLSDIWKGVRISMSSESFISSSTKISENASVVGLETGWEEACSEDYQSSESDFGLDVQDKCRHHRHRQHAQWAQGVDLPSHQTEETSKPSTMEFHTAQALLDKQANAIAQAILSLQKKDNRILYELATQPRDLDIIDHFADDIDDSFLVDSFSYSEIPDDAFGPDFDFLHEESHLYKKRGKNKDKKHKKAKTGQQHEAGAGEPATETKSAGATSAISETECPSMTVIQDVCNAKKAKKKVGKDDDEASQKPDGPGGYDACMERRRRKIEDALRNAVRSRSPMGSYRPKKGEPPLSNYKDQASPGPAVYNPPLNVTKPNIHTAVIAPRWTDNIYETPGPGPCAYLPNPEVRCTCEMLNLHEAARFQESESVGPGPACVDISQYKGTCQGKPNALIVSRKDQIKTCTAATYTNVFGWTRFGKANPPRPLILSKYERVIADPGPGLYEPKRVNRKIPITIKSRIPMPERDTNPGYVLLPDPMGEGPAPPFGIRNFMEMKDQSPGPIYKVRAPRPKGLSLTFRPFPMRGREEEPSPLEYSVLPGEQMLKTLPTAPRAPLIGKLHTVPGYISPAPNQYDVCDSNECNWCIEPGTTFTGRHGVKTETLPGPGDYDPIPVFQRAPYTVFQHKKEEKIKWDDRELLNPQFRKGIPGGSITSRWRSNMNENEGGEFVDVFGMTNRGQKTRIPISMKSRHTPFKYSHMHDPKGKTHFDPASTEC